jgi:hypothetical protein
VEPQLKAMRRLLLTLPWLLPTLSLSAQDAPPETPSAEAVAAAMNEIAPRVKACWDGPRDHVRITIAFDGATGRAVDARAERASISPHALGCMTRAAWAARVPPFAGARFSVTYPFRV